MDLVECIYYDDVKSSSQHDICVIYGKDETKCPKTFANDNFWKKITIFGNFFEKSQDFGNFLTFKWQFSGGSSTQQRCQACHHTDGLIRDFRGGPKLG